MTTTEIDSSYCWCERWTDDGPDTCPVHPDSHRPGPFDLVAFLDELARSNAANGEHQLVAGGTFALYPAPGGGVVLVLNVEQGPEGMVGTLRKKLGPGLIRALQAFGENGANPFKLAAAMAKGRKRDQSR